MVVLINLSLDRAMSFFMIVFYHVLFWNHFALPAVHKQGHAAIARYILANGVCWVALSAVSPLGPVPLLTLPQMQEIFVFLGYLHISSSLSLSDMQPTWLNRLFRPNNPVMANSKYVVAPSMNAL